MMRQYWEAKEQHKDALLLFRMGDFYELFDEDAKIAAKELGIALTTRDKGEADPVPMAGVPYHSVHSYLARLVDRGYKVAICEQMEDSSNSSGLLHREVVQVVTPGTVLEPEMLEEKDKNFLGAFFARRSTDDADRTYWQDLGIAMLEVTTGEFLLLEVDETGDTTRERHRHASNRLADLVDRYQPAELLYPEELETPTLDETLIEFRGRRSPYPNASFDGKHSTDSLKRLLDVLSLEGFGLHDQQPTPAVRAAGGLVTYLEETQKSVLTHIDRLKVVPPGEAVVLDASTRRNLELTKTIRGETGGGTLLEIVDDTETPMGGRLLKDWLLSPLTDLREIEHRHEQVQELSSDDMRAEILSSELKSLGDLERLISRACLGRASPREILSIGRSLERVPTIIGELTKQEGAVERLGDSMEPLPELAKRIVDAIVDDPPSNTREGGVFAEGFDEELDEIRAIAKEGRRWIVGYENRERESTGISSLKVGFNKVFGYYIEVTKANLEHVPEDRYERKQTLTNSERYITPELKEREEKILGAEERQRSLEKELFQAFRDEVAAYSANIRKTAHAIAKLDVLLSYARVARRRNYVRPMMEESGIIEIEAGRHPVVEALSETESFIPNDTYLDLHDHQIILLTGPNMSGKSTYLRQVAIISLMAQIGCFVPATRARLGVVDRIFTRVGASDNLAKGQSTFLVEMHETAHICHNATKQSLVILDEIGRGTSTFDGLSLAWAVAEYLHEADHLGCKTLFATHYHELTELSKTLDRLQNYHVSIQEDAEEIVFLRRVVQGGVDQSFGIHVAKLAGVPPEVIRRAREVLQNLEASELDGHGQPRRGKGTPARATNGRSSTRQPLLFTPTTHPVVEALSGLEVEHMTPLEAMNKLAELRQMVEEDD